MFGGMPALILKKTDEEKIKYLKDLINNTYIKDVVERNNIKIIQLLIFYLISLHHQLVR